MPVSDSPAAGGEIELAEHLPYHDDVLPPTDSDDWVGLSAEPLPIERALSWAVLDSCGAVVTFTGHARDHSEGRPGVSRLEYEAYESQVGPRLVELAQEVRTRWSSVGRVVLLHREGVLALGECAVIAVVSAPHRGEAFDAARFAIDALKATVPIWKRETWESGESWGLEGQHLVEVSAVPSSGAPTT